MHSLDNRSSRPPATRFVAARWMVAIGSAFLATQAMATVVTPGNLQGWVLGDGGNVAQTSPAKITGTQPDAGNGSLEFDINAGNQQPLAFHALTGLRFGDLIGSGLSFGFDWLVPVGTPSNTSPTIRLLLNGLTGTTQSGRSDGSVGWYMNTVGTGTFQTSAFSATNGDFFFRVGGVGQESLDCKSTASSFDDRRQTLTKISQTCNGAGGTANINNATVVGIEVDWGTFPGSPPAQSSFADLITYNIGSDTGNFNFELRASAVPEPESLALMLLGGLAAGAALRAQRRRGAGPATTA